jgi:hypothetical protein
LYSIVFVHFSIIQLVRWEIRNLQDVDVNSHLGQTKGFEASCPVWLWTSKVSVIGWESFERLKRWY